MNEMNISTHEEESTEKTCLERYKLTIEITGWLGCCAILVSYVGKDSIHKNLDFWLNVGGSSSILVSCIPKKVWQPIFINGAWIIATIYNFYY